MLIDHKVRIVYFQMLVQNTIWPEQALCADRWHLDMFFFVYEFNLDGYSV